MLNIQVVKELKFEEIILYSYMLHGYVDFLIESLARIESDCTFNDCLRSGLNSISKTRHSNLFSAFLSLIFVFKCFNK